MGLFNFFKPNISKLYASQDIEGLIRALDYNDSAIRGNSKESLLSIGKPAIEYIFKEMNSAEIDDRARYTNVLDVLDWKSTEISENIYYFIGKKNWGELQKIGKPAILPLLQTIEYCKKRKYEKNSSGSYTEAKNICQTIVHMGDSAVEILLDLLKTDDFKIPAVSILSELGDKRAVLPIMDQLKDLQNKVDIDFNSRNKHNMKFIEALGKLKDNRATELLIPYLEDMFFYTRWQAANALGSIRDPSAVQPLIRAIERIEYYVLGFAEKSPMSFITGYINGGAVWALGEIGDERAIEALIKNYYFYPPPPPIFGNRNNLSDLTWHGFKDVNTIALKKIGKPVVSPILAKISDKPNDYMLDVIGELGDITCLGILEDLLNDKKNKLYEDEIKKAIENIKKRAVLEN